MTAPDHAPFLDALAAAHDDPAVLRSRLLVFADAMDDAGDPHGAAGAREAARRGWRPLSNESGTCWYRVSPWRGRWATWSELPGWLLDLVDDEAGHHNFRYFHALPAAWSAYLAAFRRAAEVGRWPRPARKARASR